MNLYVTAKSYVSEQGSIAKRKALISLRRNLLVIKRGLAIETQETKVMLNTYHQYTQGNATKEEMDLANRQFGNVIRSLGLGIFVLLPFSIVKLLIVDISLVSLSFPFVKLIIVNISKVLLSFSFVKLEIVDISLVLLVIPILKHLAN